MRWTDAHDDFLRQHYKARGPRWCARKLGRSPGAVRTHAWEIGVRRRMGKSTTPEGLRRLARLRRGLGPRAGVEKYAEERGISPHSVQAMVGDYDLPRLEKRLWTTLEERCVAAELERLCEVTKRTPGAVAGKMMKMAIKPKAPPSN